MIIATERESLQHMVLLPYRIYSETLENAPSHMIKPRERLRRLRCGTTLQLRGPHASNDVNICRDTGELGPMMLFHNFPSCYQRPLGSFGKLPLNFLTPLARFSYNRIAGTSSAARVSNTGEASGQWSSRRGATASRRVVSLATAGDGLGSDRLMTIDRSDKFAHSRRR